MFTKSNLSRKTQEKETTYNFTVFGILLLYVLCLITVVSCDKTQPLEDDGTVTTPLSDSVSMDSTYTMLIYLCGSNLESQYGAATRNLEELCHSDIGEDVNIVIQAGGTSAWSYEGFSPVVTERAVVKHHAIESIDRIPKKNMGSAETLKDFISWAAFSYPADQYGLILWDHGGGSLTGVCFDELFDFDCLTLNELQEAVSAGTEKIGKKFDFIGFDACLMATYETALMLAPYAGNMVASEEKEPSGGWDYKVLAENIGKEGFYDALLSSYAEKSARKNYYTLSHINLNAFSDVTANFEELLDRMIEETPRNLIGSVQNSIAFGSAKDNLYDLGNILSYFGIVYDWSEIVRCVNAETREKATGLSLYFPLYDDKNIEKYKRNCNNERFTDMLSTFYSSQASNKIAFQSYAEAKEDKLSFVLKKTSVPYLSEVEYFLISLGDIGTLPTVYGSDNDYNLNGNTVTIEFEGRWVSFGNQLLYVTVKEKNGDHTVFESAMQVNGKEALAYFAFDRTTGKIEFMGITYTEDDHDRMYSLSVGDEIIPITCEAEQDYYIYTYSPENLFVFSDETVIELVTLPDGYYQYTAFVRDVYGNTFLAGTAVVEVKDGITELVTITDNEVEYPERIY